MEASSRRYLRSLMLSSVKPAAMMSDVGDAARFARENDTGCISQIESTKCQLHILIADSQQGPKDQLRPGLFALKMNCRQVSAPLRGATPNSDEKSCSGAKNLAKVIAVTQYNLSRYKESRRV